MIFLIFFYFKWKFIDNIQEIKFVCIYVIYYIFQNSGVELDVDRSDNRGILTLKELHPHPVAASSASLPQSTQDALMAVLEISNVPARCQGVLFESIGFPAK